MDALTTLYTTDCRLVIERQNGACFLRVSRPGAALTSATGDAYTLHIYAPTLEAALINAVAEIGNGATCAVEQAERHE
jgi:hypothetical protein